MTVAGAPEPSDLALIEKLAEGDRGAFRTFVERHQSAVFRLAQALTEDSASAEDVLQETFLAVFRHAGGFRQDASARTWLLTIARNKARRHARRRSCEPDHFEPLSALGVMAGWGQVSPEECLVRAQTRQALSQALEALSEEDREVLLLRDLEGLGGEETAAALGLSMAAMKSRLHRARLRLVAAARRDA